MILKSLNDSKFRGSWSKGKLQQQLASYDPSATLVYTDEQCQKVMKKEGLNSSRSIFRID